MTAAERQRRHRATKHLPKPATRHMQAKHAGVSLRAWQYRIQQAKTRKPLPFRFEPITHKIATAFVKRWHYSGNMPTGKTIHFGAFIGDQLYAVATYGNGANADGGAYFAKVTGLPVTRANHVTLVRLCRRGRKHKAKIAMTSFLAACHKALKREHGVRFVISYADPIMNGTTTAPPTSKPWRAGGIYAAANFRYLGQVPAEYHFRDADGTFVHRRVPYRLAQRQRQAGKKMTMAQAIAKMKLTRWRMPPKERWFLDLRP